MRNIRKTKKALKNSKGFFIIKTKESPVIGNSRLDTIRFHSKGVSINYSTYIPYALITGIIREK